MQLRQLTGAAVLVSAIGSASFAEVCDYRPSEVAPEFLSGAVTGVTAAVSTAGATLKGAGFYTLVHASTNATMLASTAGGVSAAGTVGIMGGTAGVIGTAASILVAPVVVIGTGATAAGIVVYEGGCYFLGTQDGVVSEFQEVLLQLHLLSSITDIDQFSIYVPPDDPSRVGVYIKHSDGSADYYLVRELYIQDGIVMHRRLLADRPIIDITAGFTALH